MIINEFTFVNMGRVVKNDVFTLASALTYSGLQCAYSMLGAARFLMNQQH